MVENLRELEQLEKESVRRRKEQRKIVSAGLRV